MVTAIELWRRTAPLRAVGGSKDVAGAGDRDRLREAVFDLREHIAKEEDGLFPASLTALDGEQWDAAMAAWQEAHPGQRMIGAA